VRPPPCHCAFPSPVISFARHSGFMPESTANNSERSTKSAKRDTQLSFLAVRPGIFGCTSSQLHAKSAQARHTAAVAMHYVRRAP
jgi:hypothetical protein